MGMSRRKCRNCRIQGLRWGWWCDDCVRAFMTGAAAALGTGLGAFLAGRLW